MLHRPLRSALGIAVIFSLAACDAAGTPADSPEVPTGITASAPSIRINPNPAAPSAAYFTLTGGQAADVLTGVSSPDATRAEMHESTMAGGMMSMAALDAIPVPAASTVEFRQGGKHVMLFGISDAARRAGRLTLQLDFRDGRTLPLEMAFAPAPGTAPANGATGN